MGNRWLTGLGIGIIMAGLTGGIAGMVLTFNLGGGSAAESRINDLKVELPKETSLSSSVYGD